MEHNNRVDFLNEHHHFETEGKVIYWMERDHRVYDNWALLYAQKFALQSHSQLEVVVMMSKDTMTMQGRQVQFAIEGLKEVEMNLRKFHIPLKLFHDKETLFTYLETESTGVVTDFNPLLRKQVMVDHLKKRLEKPVVEIDAHNIVPCKMIFDLKGKREHAAYTIRPKINKRIDEFLVDFPEMLHHEANKIHIESIDWIDWLNRLDFEYKAKPLNIHGGELAGMRACLDFLTLRIEGYSEFRNDPSLNFQSELSPYFHFGHLSTQRVAFLAKKLIKEDDNLKDFLEEMIIRRELTDNYCYRNLDQDTTLPFDDWAKETLEIHASDPRVHVYGIKDFENGNTHDEIWNAAQKELLYSGKMHGYLRMYWAKKILEWSNNYVEAFEIALYLNDTYAIDGNDPNGIVGVAWSIGGIHDHGWKERPIFGKIRYMNDKGCRRKFNVEAYINKVEHMKDESICTSLFNC